MELSLVARALSLTHSNFLPLSILPPPEPHPLQASLKCKQHFRRSRRRRTSISHFFFLPFFFSKGRITFCLLSVRQSSSVAWIYSFCESLFVNHEHGGIFWTCDEDAIFNAIYQEATNWRRFLDRVKGLSCLIPLI